MMTTDDQLFLTAGDVTMTVDLGAGGRISSLQVGDSELIWSGTDGVGDADPMVWGMYPMVPFAGRILGGKFTFDGTDYSIPQNHDGNAIHGYGFQNTWVLSADNEITWEFGEPWPFAGRVTQRFDLAADALTLEMIVEADERQPISIGWHPWFRRRTTAGTGELSFSAASMYERDADGMPGPLKAVPPGPWDDCFTNLTAAPSISWGDLTVTLTSDFDHWVVYDERDHGFCVEPQSGPPNEVNRTPRVLEQGESLTASFRLDFLRN